MARGHECKGIYLLKETEFIDHEKLLLSAVLNDADSLRVVVGGYPKGNIPPTDPQYESFEDKRHQALWKCFQDLLKQGQKWDGYTARVPIREWFEQRGTWGSIGDEYLTHLFDYLESQSQLNTSDVWKWAKKVKDNARKRDLSREGKALVARAEDPLLDADAVIGTTVLELVQLKLGQSTGFLGLGTYTHDIEETLGVWIDGNEIKRIPTGFKALDDKLGGGLAPGQLTVLGGRPGSFKTSWVWQVATNVAKKLKADEEEGVVAFVSLEMLAKDLLDRALCVEANVDMTLANRYEYVEDTGAHNRLRIAQEVLEGLSIEVDDEHGLTSSQIYHRVMGLQAVIDVKLVIIDYAEQIGDKNRDEEMRVSGIFTAAKGLAKDLNVPVILLTQLNREVERKADKIPELHHIRMGGQAEAVADNVFMTYYPGAYKSIGKTNLPGWVHKDEEGANPDYFYLIIAKSRYGAVDHVEFGIEPQFTKISDVSTNLTPGNSR